MVSKKTEKKSFQRSYDDKTLLRFALSLMDFEITANSNNLNFHDLSVSQSENLLRFALSYGFRDNGKFKFSSSCDLEGHATLLVKINILLTNAQL